MKEFTGFMHGINLGGWLSQCDHTKERYENFIHEEDIARIKSWGLDHIRVPVDYDLVEDPEGNYREEGFGYIQRAIDWCQTYGLNMVLDLHKTFGYSFDSGEQESGFFDVPAYQERFYRLWEQFAGRYGKYDGMLAFELLNEVTDEAYSDRWNAISATCIEKIRAIAPTIPILLGGYHNNSIWALRDLKSPADENIIYNFHFYEPLIFTHQGAYWIDTMDTEFRMHMDETYGEYVDKTLEQIKRESDILRPYDRDKVFGIEFFENCVHDAVEIAKERNVCLYCGEFGVIDRADPQDALKWYREILRCFDLNGIGRAAWSYKEMDFGFIDEHFAPVAEKVIQLL